MLNHTYTSVKNANLVDSGNKQHITSKPTTLVKDNYLGEFRTDLEKKKVLSNLGIATALSLEWEFIKGDIGASKSLMQELDSRTKYVSEINGLQQSVIDGLKYLETVIQLNEGSQWESKLSELEGSFNTLVNNLEELKTYLQDSVEVDIDNLEKSLNTISNNVQNITDLIKISEKDNNALKILTDDKPGLYVADLSKEVSDNANSVTQLQETIEEIQLNLEEFVTKEELGGEDFNFVNKSEFESYTANTNQSITNIQSELTTTLKTNSDGSINKLLVNTIGKTGTGNIKISNSFEPSSNIPLDVRFVKENLEELYNIPATTCYAGMGVIVNSLSALYILRKPDTDAKITQEYVSNPNNWKCPEDLITIALTREDYEKLEEINQNVFYYIYEEEITRTNEPKREDFIEDEEFNEDAFNEAWQEWVDSLKTLSQEYMSASWGIDIEEQLRNKVSLDTLTTLQNGIIAELTTTVNDLKERVMELEQRLQELHPE